MRLTASFTGTVQRLAVHIVGGVITSVQPLLSVLPENESMEVGAPVLNQDIRFVHPSQRATIGVGNLPYTRYGYIDGVLGSVSHDVIQGENFELSFQARMRMKEAELLVGGAKVNFAFGLLLTAEIHAGKRRVIEHILGPLRSGQERRCGGGRRTQIFTILRNGNV